MFKMVRNYSHKPEEQWRPLFFRILQNQIRDWHRRNIERKRWLIRFPGWKGQNADSEDRGDPIDSLSNPSQKNPEEWARIGDAQQVLKEALRTLPTRQQQVFLLRPWEGLNVAETASAMGCSQGSVKTHYSRAIHALRKMLEDYWP